MNKYTNRLSIDVSTSDCDLSTQKQHKHNSKQKIIPNQWQKLIVNNRSCSNKLQNIKILPIWKFGSVSSLRLSTINLESDGTKDKAIKTYHPRSYTLPNGQLINNDNMKAKVYKPELPMFHDCSQMLTASYNVIQPGCAKVHTGSSKHINAKLSRCVRCKETIRYPYVSFNNYKWCYKHFTCVKTHCGTNLVNRTFASMDNLILCEKHSVITLLVRCEGCHGTIVGERCFSSDNKCWHLDCFKCLYCRQLKIGKPFYSINGAIICLEDFAGIICRRSLATLDFLYCRVRFEDSNRLFPKADDTVNKISKKPTLTVDMAHTYLPTKLNMSRCHHSQVVKDFWEDYCITILFVPVYLPYLNQIENVFKFNQIRAVITLSSKRNIGQSTDSIVDDFSS
ncbi:hypothetical protein GJ496_010101 [Pomphorhynchus laevis]|nr:hypothetical protein GJ496_010101 [Pomphorhynchus laevis]